MCMCNSCGCHRKGTVWALCQSLSSDSHYLPVSSQLIQLINWMLLRQWKSRSCHSCEGFSAFTHDHTQQCGFMCGITQIQPAGSSASNSNRETSVNNHSVNNKVNVKASLWLSFEKIKIFSSAFCPSTSEASASDASLVWNLLCNFPWGVAKTVTAWLELHKRVTLSVKWKEH